MGEGDYENAYGVLDQALSRASTEPFLRDLHAKAKVEVENLRRASKTEQAETEAVEAAKEQERKEQEDAAKQKEREERIAEAAAIDTSGFSLARNSKASSRWDSARPE